MKSPHAPQGSNLEGLPEPEIRQYILQLRPHFRVSIMIAHLGDRALLTHLPHTPSETKASTRRRSPKWIQDLFTKKITLRIQDPISSRIGKNYWPLYRPLLCLDLVPLLMFMDPAHVWSFSRWFECFLSFPPLISPLLFIMFFVGSPPNHERSAPRVPPYITSPRLRRYDLGSSVF